MSITTYTITLTPTNDELLINQQGQVTPQQIELYFGALIKGDKGDKGDTGAQGPAGADGVDGQDGVGISSVALNADYTLTITLTNGTSYTTSSIRGAQGPQGVQGNTGATGNGIASTVLNADYTLTITFTDGTSYTTSPIRGLQGPAGQDGEDGDDGQDGAPGPNQVNNTTDSNITGLLKGTSGKVAQAVAGQDYVAPENGKGLSSNDYTTAEKTKLAGLSNYDDTEVRGDISSIEAVIPDTATVSNKLADQAFVNSSIATNAATFRGNVTAADDTETAAQTALATIAIKDNNDYANVVVPDTPNAGVDKYKRYTFNGTVWSFNYAINTSGFTATQWAAINSGATAEVVAAIAGKYVKPSGGIPSSDMSDAVQTSLGKADTALQSHQSLSEYRKSSEQDVIDVNFLRVKEVKANGNIILKDGVNNEREYMAATPSGDPAHYLYVARGATYNADTGLWTVGSFDDYTTDEVRYAYMNSLSYLANTFNGAFSSYAGRCMLPIIIYGAGLSFSNANVLFYRCMCREIVFLLRGGSYDSIQFKDNSGLLFNGCSRLVKIRYLYNLNITNYTTTFSGCVALEEILFHSFGGHLYLPDSSLYKPSAVAQAISVSGTNTGTISLNATAYANAIADANVQAQLQAHPNITLTQI